MLFHIQRAHRCVLRRNAGQAACNWVPGDGQKVAGPGAAARQQASHHPSEAAQEDGSLQLGHPARPLTAHQHATSIIAHLSGVFLDPDAWRCSASLWALLSPWAGSTVQRPGTIEISDDGSSQKQQARVLYMRSTLL